MGFGFGDLTGNWVSYGPHNNDDDDCIIRRGFGVGGFEGGPTAK